MKYYNDIVIKSLNGYRKYCRAEYTEVDGNIIVKNKQLSLSSFKFPPEWRTVMGLSQLGSPKSAGI